MKLGQVPLVLRSTDMPEPELRPPIQARVELMSDKLLIHVERTGTLGGDLAYDFELLASDILGFSTDILPDPPEEELGSGFAPPSSTLTVRHRDQYEVVPFFTTVFSSSKSYWIRGFRKHLVEVMGLSDHAPSQSA